MIKQIKPKVPKSSHQEADTTFLCFVTATINGVAKIPKYAKTTRNHNIETDLV
jgi:hypothetical protein